MLLNVVMNIKLIRSQSYYDPELRIEEDPHYYQQPASPTYDNEQERVEHEQEHVEDVEAIDGTNVDIEEDQIEGMEKKEVSKKRFGSIQKTQTPVQVNLDQLVEKVRERLLGDVKEQNTIRLKQQVKKSRMVGQRTLKQKGNLAPNKNKQDDGRDHSEIIEQHDLYEKTSIQKGKKDSYEDYAIPKKENNAFISVEEEELTSPAKVNKVPRQPVKKVKNVGQGQVGQGPRGQGAGGQGASGQGARGQKARGQKARGQKARGRGVREQRPDGQGPVQKKRFKQIFPKRKKKTTYVAPEYDDDTPSPTTPQLKVRTEILGQIDYKDLSIESLAKSKAEYVTAKSKQARIVTNMQTRARFSFSSPNYYAKLPRIAEKYNFDEPIPEKDQEEEKLKAIVYDPDVLINKKMQVNPQATLPMHS